jgi:hypothetical protein
MQETAQQTSILQTLALQDGYVGALASRYIKPTNDGRQ